MKQQNPMHPGEFIDRVYLTPNKVSNDELAIKLEISEQAADHLIDGKIDVSPEMALKLSKALGQSPESWLQMQNNYNQNQQ